MKRILIVGLLLNAALLTIRVLQEAGTPAEAQATPTEVILDNRPAAGPWIKSGAPNPYGADSLYCSTADRTYSWVTNLAAGNYDVYVWWTSWPSRTPQASYEIEFKGGVDGRVKDQRVNGGQWNLLGTWRFDGTAAVTLFTGGTYSHSADAVRFVKRPVVFTEREQEILSYMSLHDELPTDSEQNFVKTIRFTGANVQIVNGLGSTNGGDLDMGREGNPLQIVTNGTGNLIIGYNEPRSVPNGSPHFARTGSHNLIMGAANDYISIGGLALGRFLDLSGPCTVGFGEYHDVSGNFAVVSGGLSNVASGAHSTVSGGADRQVQGESDWRAGELFQEK